MLFLPTWREKDREIRSHDNARFLCLAQGCKISYTSIFERGSMSINMPSAENVRNQTSTTSSALTFPTMLTFFPLTGTFWMVKARKRI